MIKKLNFDTHLSNCCLDHSPQNCSEAKKLYDDIRQEIVDNLGFPGEIPEEEIPRIARQVAKIRIQNANRKPLKGGL